MLDCVFRNLDRVTLAVAGLWCENVNTCALTDHLQLVDRIWSLQVGGNKQRRLVLIFEPLSQLAGECGLTRTLKTGKHDHGRWLLRELELALFPSENLDQFFVDNLNDLLGGV